MIPDQEIRRIARRLGMEPRIIDLDYTLGWALWGMRQHPYLRDRLVFKGGTCLRKCWFPGYRFSEDLDFTATESFSRNEFEEAVQEAFRKAGESTGIDFHAEAPRSEVIEEAYGRESLRFHIYFIGSHPRPNPRAIRVDITRHETVVFPPRTRAVFHDYSDAEDVDGWKWSCYSLEETLAEKLRAVLGQRRFAISRDLYDIYNLSSEELDLEAVKEALPSKIAARDIEADEVSEERMMSRKDEFEDDWRRNLIPLVPGADGLSFESVWEETAGFVRQFTPVKAKPPPDAQVG